MQPQPQGATAGVVRPYLTDGEELRWSGRPNPGRLVGTQDLKVALFTLVFAAVTLLFAWKLVPGAAAAGLLIPSVVAIYLAVQGQYFLWGRFIYRWWDRRRTVYAVTNRRILILRGGSLQAAPWPGHAFVTSRRADGTGSIDFEARHSSHADYWVTLGAGLWSKRYRPLAFLDIPDVGSVYDLIARSTQTNSPQRAARPANRGGGMSVGWAARHLLPLVVLFAALGLIIWSTSAYRGPPTEGVQIYNDTSGGAAVGNCTSNVTGVHTGGEGLSVLVPRSRVGSYPLKPDFVQDRDGSCLIYWCAIRDPGNGADLSCTRVALAGCLTMPASDQEGEFHVSHMRPISDTKQCAGLTQHNFRSRG